MGPSALGSNLQPIGTTSYLVTNVTPGSIALMPLIWSLSQEFQSDSTFHWTIAYAAITFMVITAGQILENLGSQIETLIDQRLFKGKDSNWDRYLALKIKDEYIAQRYLRTIVMRLKFELAMIPAIIFSVALAFICAPTRIAIISNDLLRYAVLASPILAWYLYYEAKNSVKVAHRVRTTLIDAHSKAPAEKDS
jgi:hypothetical protein